MVEVIYSRKQGGVREQQLNGSMFSSCEGRTLSKSGNVGVGMKRR